MGEYSRQEAAERAGISLDELNRLVEVGILTPGEGDRLTAGDVRKAELVRSLEATGVPLEGIGAAVRSGMFPLDFMDSPAYERFSALSTETFQELSQRTGIPVEFLMVIREAAGSAQPSPNDRVREAELAVLPLGELFLGAGFRPVLIERILRVYGESLRRIAEVEADFWRSEIIMPLLASGQLATDVTQAKLAEEFSARADEAILALLHMQQAHAWTGNIINGFELILDQAGLHRRVERPPAMCFLDLTGYTRLTAERGDEAAAQLATDLSRLVQRTSVQHGGKPVKWLGDGVMFYFPDPGPGVVAAVEMAEGVASAELPPAHVGLHAGPVVFQEGDYFGQTVNVASRIAEYARPGEVLVSQAVVDAAGGAPVAFSDIGEVELKGVAGPMHLHSAHRM